VARRRWVQAACACLSALCASWHRCAACSCAACPAQGARASARRREAAPHRLHTQRTCASGGASCGRTARDSSGARRSIEANPLGALRLTARVLGDSCVLCARQLLIEPCQRGTAPRARGVRAVARETTGRALMPIALAVIRICVVMVRVCKHACHDSHIHRGMQAARHLGCENQGKHAQQPRSHTLQVQRTSSGARAWRWARSHDDESRLAAQAWDVNALCRNGAGPAWVCARGNACITSSAASSR
jgi:hypothetical protein